MENVTGGLRQTPEDDQAKAAHAARTLAWAEKQWGVRDPHQFAEEYERLAASLSAFEDAMCATAGFSTPLLAAAIVRYFGGCYGPDALFYTDFLVAARKYDAAGAETDRRNYGLAMGPRWSDAAAERFDITPWKRSLFRSDAMALHQMLGWFVTAWSEGAAKAVIREVLSEGAV